MLVPSVKHFCWRMSNSSCTTRCAPPCKLGVSYRGEGIKAATSPWRYTLVSDARDPAGTKLRCPSFVHAASDCQRLEPSRSDRCTANAATRRNCHSICRCVIAWQTRVRRVGGILHVEPMGVSPQCKYEAMHSASLLICSSIYDWRTG